MTGRPAATGAATAEVALVEVGAYEPRSPVDADELWNTLNQLDEVSVVDVTENGLKNLLRPVSSARASPPNAIARAAMTTAELMEIFIEIA